VQLMPQLTKAVLLSIVVYSLFIVVRAQENPTVVNLSNLKTVIVATDVRSDSVIAVPPSMIGPPILNTL